MRTNTSVRRSRRHARRRLHIFIGILAVLAILITILFLLILPKKTPSDVETPVTPQAEKKPTVTLPLPESFINNNTACKHIVLYDLTNDKVLYSKQADVQCYPASMTKLLTAAVTLKYADENTVFTVGEEIRLIDPESSVAHLHIGNRLDLQTLLEAMLLPSGNDAAYVAAANVGRIIAGNDQLSAKDAIRVFCEQMNTTAREIGATHSHFANPDGIHQATHYTTAADMLQIAKYAYAQPLIAAVVKEDKVIRTLLSGESGITWYNTNYLLRTDTRYYFEDAFGLKTGHTDQAGYCLAAGAEHGGVKLLAILMNSPNGEGRFADAAGLFTVCFDNLS